MSCSEIQRKTPSSTKQAARSASQNRKARERSHDPKRHMQAAEYRTRNSNSKPALKWSGRWSISRGRLAWCQLCIWCLPWKSNKNSNTFVKVKKLTKQRLVLLHRPLKDGSLAQATAAIRKTTGSTRSGNRGTLDPTLVDTSQAATTTGPTQTSLKSATKSNQNRTKIESSQFVSSTSTTRAHTLLWLPSADRSFLSPAHPSHSIFDRKSESPFGSSSDTLLRGVVASTRSHAARGPARIAGHFNIFQPAGGSKRFPRQRPRVSPPNDSSVNQPTTTECHP